MYLGLALLGKALGAFITHGFQRAYAALVAGASGLDALPNPVLFLRQAFVEQSVTCFLFFQSLLFELQVVGVVAGPADDAAAINLHDAGRKFLRKRAIVRDENNAAFVAANFVLEPLNGGDVQMVGGLVQQQQIGFADQGFRQCHTPSPAPGQFAEQGIRWQGQLADNRLYLQLGLPAAKSVDTRLHLLQRFKVLGALCLTTEIGEGGDQRHLRRQALGHDLAHSEFLSVR